MINQLFILSWIAFFTFYILRGLTILSWLPGWLILFPLLIAISSGLIWGIKKTSRF